jgi:ketosteroid isomerase-like protein
MSQADEAARNAVVMHRYAAAWLANERAEIVACYHPDFTLHYAGANPLSGVHRGKPAALAALAAMSQKTARQLLEVIEVMPGARRSAIVVRESFHRDGTMAELERVLVYTVRDDLLFECWVHDQDQALVDRFLA